MSSKKLLIFICILVSFSYSQTGPATSPVAPQPKVVAAPSTTPTLKEVTPSKPKAALIADDKSGSVKGEANAKEKPLAEKKTVAGSKRESKTDAAALRRYEEKYNEMVRDRDDLISSESVAKNIAYFLKRFRKDLSKQGISGKIIVRDIAFDTSLVKDGSNLIVYRTVFFDKDNGGKDIELIPNEYKNKLFYFVDDSGISIEKGVSRGSSFTKVMKKENVSYSVSFALRFVNQELQMVTLVKDIKDETVFTKTYTQAYKMYGILKYHERKIRMGLGLDMGLGSLLSTDAGENAPKYLILPNIFAGFFIPRVGVGGVQIDVAFFDSFDYFSFTGYFNWDFMETAKAQLPAHVLLEARLGFGFQFRDAMTTSTFLTFGTGLRLDIYDTFFFRAGINFYLTKKSNSRQINGILSKNLLPPQITFGGGFYIL